MTVHGRTRCQFYKGKADWKAIAGVKDAISVPLIANGDCGGCDDALRMLEASGADGVMIGRGAYGRPWLPGHIGHFLTTGERLAAPSGNELADIVVGHYEDILSHYGQLPGLRIARKHLGWYLDEAGEAGMTAVPAGIRKTLMTSSQPGEVMRLAADWFSSSNERTAA